MLDRRWLARVALIATVVVALLATGARAATDAEFVAAAKRVPVRRLDPRLPDIDLERWFRHAAEPNGTIAWEANDCGEACGCPADSGRDMPVCVEATATFADSSTAMIRIGMGSASKGIWGEPGLYDSEIARPGRSAATFDSLSTFATALAKLRH